MLNLVLAVADLVNSLGRVVDRREVLDLPALGGGRSRWTCLGVVSGLAPREILLCSRLPFAD